MKYTHCKYCGKRVEEIKNFHPKQYCSDRCIELHRVFVSKHKKKTYIV